MIDQRAREHLIDFSIATNPKYEPNWHHDLIAKELEDIEKGLFVQRGYKVLILCLPPRHGKSEECTINLPAWYLGRNPDKEIITASYSAELALDFGSKTRTLVDSENFKRIFDLELKKDEKGKAKWKTDKNGSYTSVGIGGPITGRGANILIIDDPIKNAEEAASKTIRDKHWEWFRTTAYTRLEPNGVVILILTRWHLDDLAGRILANSELKAKCKLIVFPAIAIEDERYRKKGEPLWAMRYPLKELESIKNTIGVYNWASLYQQNPVLTENQEFKQDWIKYRTRGEVEKLKTRNFLTIDTAYSERTSGDNIGFCENYVDKENNWNLSAYKMKMNPKDFVDYLFTIQDKRSFEKIGIEKTAYLVGLKPYIDEECRKRDRFLPVVELHHNQTAKETRIRGLIPRYSSKAVYHLEGECQDLEDEMFTFPKGMTDDVIDATAYQNDLAEPPKSEENNNEDIKELETYDYEEW